MAAFSGFLDDVQRILARPSYLSVHVETDDDVISGRFQWIKRPVPGNREQVLDRISSVDALFKKHLEAHMLIASWFEGSHSYSEFALALIEEKETLQGWLKDPAALSTGLALPKVKTV